MSQTCRVTINGRARAAEVHVPIFCSHGKLPPLGACRICVVEVGTPRLGPDKKPVLGEDGQPEIAWMPKVQTGCTTPVSDGMHVRTESAVAVKARKGVMEFLLVNHPLDCPVCDEGGECQLQDLAFAFGQDFSRMEEAKRTFDSEDLGPVVKKEANRCIVCMRCVRYCDEVMGDDALTAHQRGVWTEISSFDRQPLECEQCGNCIEVCPVGALTALPYRFKARPWDLRQHVTICPWCSNGCSVRLGVRGDEVLRARGTEFRGVNQEYLCVRGRFGYEFVNHSERLAAPLLRMGGTLSPASFDEAVTLTATRLREIAAVHGPEAIAFLGGEKLLVEEQYLFQKLARAVVGTPHVDARTRLTARVPGAAILAATGGGRPQITLADLVDLQEALVLGEDLQGEAPYIQAQLVRGVHQRGLHLTVAHPRQVKLAREKFHGDWLAHRPGSERALLAGLTRALLALGDPPSLPDEARGSLDALRQSLAAWTPEWVQQATGLESARIEAAAQRLRNAERKAIVFGRAVLEHPEAPALLAAIETLGWASGALASDRSSILYAGPHNDSQGALDMGLTPDRLPGYALASDPAARQAFEPSWGASLPRAAGLAAPEILRAAAEGRIKALWIVSDHWLRSAPDRALVDAALAKIDLVIVSDLFLTDTAARAHVVFPAVSFAEKEGVVINCERRLQRSVRALHPRRGARSDGEIFQAVAQAMGARWSYRTSEDVFREIARLVPLARGVSWGALLVGGHPWASERPLVAATLTAFAPPAPVPNGDALWLLSGGTLFLQGSLSHHGSLLPKLAREARARMHPDEARRRGLDDGDVVELAGQGGALRIALRHDATVPEGSVFVPYAYAEVELNRLGAPTSAGLRVTARKAAMVPA
ncbi:MAG: NADH-quinone oxidoreductase subunit NuoG [Candidatus Eisenbacteria bacterium]|uniref:NADH-quinone oxidoreductase n=1 Tax=Eiseniibacteriota bacterium TaxID=2212470 RepID=A0A538U9J7_UNCEI|nr:MAG: NADH-quinone oxidoreductase subunit NuoG [Candidatus Eisenbacteria bacterium]